MKAKNILLSAIILGGFAGPIIQTVDANAATFSPKVEQTQSKAKFNNNQIARENILKLSNKIDLTKLNAKTSLSIPATTVSQKSLGDVYLNLTTEQLGQLQQSHSTAVQMNNLIFTLDKDAELNYQVQTSDLKLNYDQTSQTLTLQENGQSIDHLTYQLISGDALVHYVYEDTNEEIHVETLTYIGGDAPYPVGHFDAVSIDFEMLANSDISLDPALSTTKLDPITITFDRNDITPENAEFTAKLIKAKPQRSVLKVYLNGELYSSKTVDSEINSKIETAPKGEKLPDSKQATLNPNKTTFRVYNEYFPQLGTVTQDGRAIHRSVFGRGLSTPRTKDFLERLVAFAVQDNTEEFPMEVEEEKTGSYVEASLYYESPESDTPNDKDIITNKVTISSNLGDQVVDKVSGKIGETVTVKVPQKDGYTSDKDSVTAKVNADGTITTDETITYTKIKDSEKPTPPVTTPIPHPESFNGFVATMSDTVLLYHITDGKVTKVSNRALDSYSDWKTDKIITIDGTKYYRVGANEWTKAKDIYRYENKHGVVGTKDVEATRLVNSNAQTVRHRALGANTDWQYDRIAYLGEKETPHFRVATKEFVNAQDVTQK